MGVADLSALHLFLGILDPFAENVGVGNSLIVQTIGKKVLIVCFFYSKNPFVIIIASKRST